MALIREDDLVRLAAPAALETGSWRIGVMRGTTGEAFATQSLKRSTIVTFDTVAAALAALQDHQIDYFIDDAPTIWRLAAEPAQADQRVLGLFQPLTEEYLAWAVRPSDEALGQQLNDRLTQWRSTGRLQAIIARWIRTTVEVH